MRPALFLDRDGIINVDHGYVFRREDFQFMPGIFELCREAKKRNYLLFVVTNQAGIGRGYYTEADFLELTCWMCEVFADEACEIDKVYFCPTHPEHGVGEYKMQSLRRKPSPGMILEALAEYDVDVNASVLVGDKMSDVQAGMAAGIPRNFLVQPLPCAPLEAAGVIVVRDLSEVRSLLPSNA